MPSSRPSEIGLPSRRRPARRGYAVLNSLASVTQRLRVSISTDAACIRAQFTKDHLARAAVWKTSS